MSEMNNTFTPKQVVESEKRISFDIPIFQRLFVWEDRQILQLLEDLYVHFNRHPAEPTKDPASYYIGIITVVERQVDDRTDSDDSIDVVWEIVDGQQRLTFLMLLATQFKDVDGWKNFFLPKTQRIRYIGRPEDEKSLLCLYQGSISQSDNANMNRFVACFEQFVKCHGDIGPDFKKAVYASTAFLVSKLDPAYSPFELNTFFEKINSTGRQLEPEDIVKGLYFSAEAEKWNTLIDFSAQYSPIKPTPQEDLANNKNSTIKKILASTLLSDVAKEPPANEVSPHESIRGIFSVSVFLLHVLRLCLGKHFSVSLNPRKLVETFKMHKGAFEPANFVQNMEAYRLWLDTNIVHQSDEGFQFWGESKACNSDYTDNEFKSQSLLQFQSMLVVSSSESQEWVIEAYERYMAAIESAEVTSVGNLLNALIDQDKKRNPLPSEQEAFQYPNVNRYWFWRLDYLLWEHITSQAGSALTGSQDKRTIHFLPSIQDDTAPNNLQLVFTSDEIAAVRNFKFKTNRSIEHLYPQNPKDSITAWQNSPERDNFGNLAMISPSLNSEQSNDPFKLKFERFMDKLEHGNLESIKMLIMFKYAKLDSDGWTPVKAKTLGETMISMLPRVR